MQATENLMQGRTTFMIAHRLHTLKTCDMILVLEHGRLVEVRNTLPEFMPGANPLTMFKTASN
jgi:ABC-type multidrug transport system fused ATPase/permease subunit